MAPVEYSVLHSTTGAGLSAFKLDDDGTNSTGGSVGSLNEFSNSKTFTISGPNFGPKSVTENVPAGWSLSAVVCMGAQGSTISGATASFTVSPGDQISCSYENKKDATVTITKNAIPDSGQNFDYETTGNGLSAFTLEDDGNESDEPATPGTGGDWPRSRAFTLSGTANFGAKSVTETVPTNWTNTGLSCSEGTQSGQTASFTADPGDVISCTYENKKDATVTVYKYEDKNGSGTKDPTEPFLSGWTFKAYPGSSTTPAATQQTDSSGKTTFSLKPDQSYRICETLQGGWFNTDPGNVAPNTDPCETTLVLTPGQPGADRYFGNRLPAITGARTKGFWRNKNGQGIIKGSCNPSGKPSLYTFLTQYNPFKDLASSSCTDIAAYVTAVVDAASSSGSSMNPMLKAQMLATARGSAPAASVTPASAPSAAPTA